MPNKNKRKEKSFGKYFKKIFHYSIWQVLVVHKISK